MTFELAKNSADQRASEDRNPLIGKRQPRLHSYTQVVPTKPGFLIQSGESAIGGKSFATNNHVISGSSQLQSCLQLS
jgi:hypothetical protein